MSYRLYVQCTRCIIHTLYFYTSTHKDPPSHILFAELMDRVVRQVVQPALNGIYQHMSYVGSSYELSSLSGSSDYDIQVFLKMPPGPGKRNVPKPTTGRIHKCDRKGWRKIYGGPAHLLTGNGYLSACKVSFQS